jgi:arylsulfatase A-like enzyme
MDVFAGFAEHTDHEVGRLLTALEARGELENTVFLYIVGDNGSSAEGGMIGTYNENTPVVLSCKGKDRFTGRIGSVTIETFPGTT